jgi:hypothetical protein
MHVVLVNVTLNDPEAALEFLKSSIIPRVSQSEGFVAGYWYGDGQTKGASTIVFQSEENAQAFVEMLRAQEGTGAATIDNVETQPVVANA